jgi:MoxR-like ATPase
VIGDELDLETYGRSSKQRSSENAMPRVRASVDRGAARARRVNSHQPPRAVREPMAAARARIDADGVRTVKIDGRPAGQRRRSSGRAISLQLDRYDRRPDRAAQWALFMGVFMIAVAIITGT